MQEENTFVIVWFADACFDLFLLTFSFIFVLTNISSINLSLAHELGEDVFSHGLRI